MSIVRRPDNVMWSKPWDCFCVGFVVQRFWIGAGSLTVCIGPLTLRWHWR